MTTNTIEVSKPVIQRTRAIGGKRFNLIVVALGIWLMIGGYSDAWAHNHLPLDNFFTPWHAAFYSGVLVSFFFMVGTFVRNRLSGYPAHLAMPEGYELSLIGVLIVAFGGVGDMIWHILFGIELNIDGAFSPTHIAVTIGLALIVSGPYRALWHSSIPRVGASLLSLLPMLLSLAFTLSVITIITQIFHPFVNIWASDPTQSNEVVAVTAMFLQTGILMGLVLFTLRRWQLPFGSLTLVLTLNMLFLSFMHDHYIFIPVVLLAGLIADVLVWKLRPSVKNPTSFYIFAFTVPIVLYLLYFLSLKLTTGVYWTIHLWLGSTFITGIVGFLLCLLLVPPALPAHIAE